MVEYKDVLYKLRITDLKELIRRYMKEVKVKITGLKKEELIEHILKHTEYKDKKIVSKVANVNYNISSYSENMKKIDKPKVNTTSKAKEKEIDKPKVKPNETSKKQIYTEEELKKLDEMEKRYGIQFYDEPEKPKEEKEYVYERNKIPLLEYLEPYQDYEDTQDDKIKDIYMKVGEEIDKHFNDAKLLEEKLDLIPNLGDTLELIREWAEKKTRSGKNEVEYTTFVKSVVYNMFLKKELDKITKNMFESIALANLIATDTMLSSFYTNRTYINTVETFFKLNPQIPKKDYPPNVLKKYTQLYTDYERGLLPSTSLVRKQHERETKKLSKTDDDKILGLYNDKSETTLKKVEEIKKHNNYVKSIYDIGFNSKKRKQIRDRLFEIHDNNIFKKIIEKMNGQKHLKTKSYVDERGILQPQHSIIIDDENKKIDMEHYRINGIGYKVIVFRD